MNRLADLGPWYIVQQKDGQTRVRRLSTEFRLKQHAELAAQCMNGAVPGFRFWVVTKGELN